MGDLNTTTVSGVDARGYRRAASGTGPWDQYVVPVRDRIVSYAGRTSTFITPGRAAVSQKILALHNATSSTVLICINRVVVDVLCTATKAITIIPPLIRINRFTALPTGGTALTKTPMDTSQSSSSSVTVFGDASADGTLSGTPLAVTIPAGSCLHQKYGPRLFGTSPIGYEPIDTAPFFEGEPDITLRALEGICVHLDQAVVTTGNPSSDRWVATIDYEEYTRP